MNIQDLSSIIQKRRSIYPEAYNDQTIDDASIHTILENANWAPNHKRLQPWRFKVFQGEGLKTLSTYLGDTYTQRTPEEKFNPVVFKRYTKRVLKSSHVIAICMHHDEEDKIPEWENIAAVSMAVQNMWLSCSALGIGAYWASPSLITKEPTLLELSHKERCLGLFFMGYPSDEVEAKEGKREDISDYIQYFK